MARPHAAETPSTWLAAQRDHLVERLPGRALDVACGAGRNAFFLAGLGFDVDAIDSDAAAIATVRRASPAVNAVVADVTSAEFPRAPYAVVVNLNFLERSILSRLADALAPGGLLVFETFARAHVDVLGRRMNSAYLLEPRELLGAFPGLRVLRYREGVLDEEPPRGVASLVARNDAAV